MQPADRLEAQARAEAERAYARTYARTKRRGPAGRHGWLLAGIALAASTAVAAGVMAIVELGREDPTPACDGLVGLPTGEVLDGGECKDGDDTALFTFASYDCPDGRLLAWNDYGWGYDPGAWQAHGRDDGQLVPPQADLDTCS